MSIVAHVRTVYLYSIETILPSIPDIDELSKNRNFAIFHRKIIKNGLFKSLVLWGEKRDHARNGIASSYDGSSLKIYQPHLDWLSLPATLAEENSSEAQSWVTHKIVKVLCFTIWHLTRRGSLKQVRM